MAKGIGGRRAGHGYTVGVRVIVLWAAAGLAACSPTNLQRNLVYSQPGGHALHLDLFSSRGAQRPAPAIVFFHQGGWYQGDKSLLRQEAEHEALRGMAAACVQYRLSTEAPYPAALEDARESVRWLRRHAADYGIDPTRIAAAGSSSGGYLAAMLATEGAVKAAVAFYPVTDFVSFGQAAPHDRGNFLARFLGCSYAESPDLWQRASLVDRANARSAPLLILHGAADDLIPWRHSEALVERLRQAGVQAEFVKVDGAEHGFLTEARFHDDAVRMMEEFLAKALQ
jgi:acetyl esterase/lipase